MWGSGGIGPPFLTSALGGSERSASRPFRFILGERARGTLWTGGYVSLSAGLDAVEKKHNLHCRESNLGHAERSQLLYRLIYRDSLISVEPKFVVAEANICEFKGLHFRAKHT
jgi:hypothetical protein